MRERMGEMQAQIQEFIASLNRELAARTAQPPEVEGPQQSDPGGECGASRRWVRCPPARRPPPQVAPGATVLY